MIMQTDVDRDGVSEEERSDEGQGERRRAVTLIGELVFSRN